MDKLPSPTIQDLYPELSDAERAEAEENLNRYLALVQRICGRLESYPQAGTLTPKWGTLPCTPPPDSGSSNQAASQ